MRLTDERDLFFLYTLRLGEEDFQRYLIENLFALEVSMPGFRGRRGVRWGTGGVDPPPPPWKIIKLQVSLGIWYGPPLENQNLAIIGLPAKHHFNGILLAGRQWPILVTGWVQTPFPLCKIS